MMRPILVILFAFSLFNAIGQTEARQKQFNLSKGLALQGYDPVSYFDAKPLQGKEHLRVIRMGVIYQFATKTNLDKFKSTPDKYEPAYGGWCAYAMGETGEKVKIDPETYKIVAGRLYLFYNFWGNNTLLKWNKDEKKLKEAGDLHWKKIVQ
jgi:YHS domain-containing protein